jgi:hypothetical protein
MFPRQAGYCTRSGPQAGRGANLEQAESATINQLAVYQKRAENATARTGSGERREEKNCEFWWKQSGQSRQNKRLAKLHVHNAGSKSDVYQKVGHYQFRV